MEEKLDPVFCALVDEDMLTLQHSGVGPGSRWRCLREMGTEVP